MLKKTDIAEVKQDAGEETFLPRAGRRRPIGPRAALIAGFTILLGIMGVLAIDSLRALRELERTSTQIRQEQLTRERALRTIRATIYESGNLLQEYPLGDARPDARRSYRSQLEGMRQRVNEALASCLAGAPSSLREHLTKLSAELEHYWVAASKTLEDEVHSPAQLHLDALAQRQEVLDITAEVSSINELELEASERDISGAYAGAGQRLRNLSVLAIGLGFLLAVGATLYITRLERDTEDKYRESLRTARELKDLSRRLVDAQEQERQAISRDLHDHVGQSLTALLMDVQSLMDAPEVSARDQNTLGKIKSLAEECAGEVRNMALLLRPSMLDDLGLIAALEWQGREVSRRTGLIVDIVADEFADNLGDEQKTCIYRVVQEALHNSAKHAKARHVRVSVREVLSHVILSIEDDGIGFDPARRRGLGMLGMQERANRLDGALVVESSPGGGTRVCVDLPKTRTVSAGEVAS